MESAADLVHNLDMSVEIDVEAAKTQLCRLLDQAVAGEEVIIMRYGQPMVRLMPVATALTPRVLGTAKGMIKMSDDFDDPLPADILDSFER